MRNLRHLWRAEVESVLQGVDLFDLRNWRNVSNTVPGVGDANLEAAQQWPGQPVQDGFLSLYKRVPEVAEEHDPAHLGPLADIFTKGMETPGWQQLRDTCSGDLVASAVGGRAFVEDVLRGMPEEVQEKAREAAQEAQRTQKDKAKAEALQEVCEALQDAVDEGKASPGQLSKMKVAAWAAQADADEGEALAQAAAEALGEAMDANDAQVMGAIQKAGESAQGDAEAATRFCKGFSEAAGGDPGQVDLDTIRAAMEVFDEMPDLRDFADQLGWAKRMVLAEWRKSPRGKTSPVGFKMRSPNMPTMAASEIVRMVSDNEVIRLDWDTRAAQGEILHKDYEGDEPEGAGDVITVLDESGSMGGASMRLAKALEWALIETTRRDNRNFWCIPFAGQGDYHVWAAPPTGLADPQGLLQHIKHFYSGGTEIYQPLVTALELLEAEDAPADILVITDALIGEPRDWFLQAVRDARARRPQLRIEVVLVGWNGSRAEQWADRITTVESLTEGREAVREVIGRIV